MLSLAVELAQIAISEVADYRSLRYLQTKSDGSPVTDLDRSLEQKMAAHIKRCAPDHGIVGEEHGKYHPERDWVWILDPIDGTRQFAAGLPNYGSLIALCHHHQPAIGVIVHPPTRLICLGATGRPTTINGKPVQTNQVSELQNAIVCLSDPDAFDQRTLPGYNALKTSSLWNVYDGGCIGHVALATGKVSVALSGPNLEPFDIAALIPVINGAGGLITDWAGNKLNAQSSGEIVATSNIRLHEATLELLAV